MAAGQLSADDTLHFDPTGGPDVRGGFALQDLKLTEPGSSDALLAWKFFGTAKLHATASKLSIPQLTLTGPIRAC